MAASNYALPTVATGNTTASSNHALPDVMAQTPVASAARVTLTRTLSLGSTDAKTGGEVTKLQQFLISQGLMKGSATGYFGALTQAAVQKFQSQKDIVSSGTPATTGYGSVGAKTRSMMAGTAPRATSPQIPSESSSSKPASTPCPIITRTLFRGMSGLDVSALQKFFYDQYKNFPEPTGYFGMVTEAALKQWQKERGIVSSGSPATTGWGVAGPKTRAALAKCR